MLYIGVDPGLTGYIACVTDTGLLLEVSPMPVNIVGGKQVLNLGTLISKFQALGSVASYKGGNVRVFLEQVHAMPKQGVSSTFTFGKTYGAIECAIVAAALPYEYIKPNEWKKAMCEVHERDAGKNGSLVAIERMFPHWMALIPKGPRSGRYDHNACDAVLIAEYGRRRAANG